MRSLLMSLILMTAGAAQAQSVLVCRTSENGQSRSYEIRTEQNRYAVLVDGKVLWQSTSTLTCLTGLGLYCESQDRRQVISLEPTPDRNRVRLVTNSGQGTTGTLATFATDNCRNPNIR